MKRLISILSLLLFPLIALSQVAKAPLRVTVMNKQRAAIANDKITFIGQKSKKEFVGITNTRGQFMVHLPAGDDYAIKVEVIGDEIDYNTFEVPTPPPGAVFKTVDLEIVYELPESVTLENVTFASGSATIRSSSYESLDELAEYLMRKETVKIRIEGHTDSDGSPAKNLTLSQNRANAVKKYLVNKGIASTRLTTAGKGDTLPIASNDTAEGKAMNRRTEVHITD